jgi:mannosyltransferase
MKINFRFLTILLLALILRVIALNTRGIWYDDAFSIFLSGQPLSNIVAGTAADTMPPLYYFLLHYWMMLGSNLWILRLLNVTLSMVGILVLYRIALTLFNTRMALFSALFAAVSPFQIYHAQELRMYALLELAQLGFILCFIKMLEPGPKRHSWPWAGLVITGTLAMYTHNLAVFFLIAPALYITFKRRWKDLFTFFKALLLIVLLFLPWFVMVPGQIQKIQTAFWTPVPGLVEVVQAMIFFTSNLPLQGWQLQVAAFLGLAVWILVLIFSIFISLKTKEDRPAVALLWSLVLFPPTALFLISYLMRPVFVARGFITSTLIFLLLGGWLCSQWLSKTKLAAVILSAIFIGISLITLPYQYSFSSFPRSPFQEMVTGMRAVVKPGDKIIHDNKLSYFPSRYYGGDLPQSFIADQPGSHNDTLAPASQKAMGVYPEPDIASAAGNADSIYFIVFTRTIEEYGSMNQPDHPVLSWLKNHYRYKDKTTYGDLEVYSFVK